MPFISFSFALFFVILGILYFAAQNIHFRNNSAQQILLLAASLVFYAFADLRFVPFLFYIIAFTYLAGRFCKNRLLLALFIIADLAQLLFFKYVPQNWHKHLIFPLGLSFFTFQSVSYIADVYTKKIEAEKNPLTVALFVSFFPVISSGPIQRAGNLIPQLKTPHTFDYDNATDGMKLFAWGMFKKLCIADRIAVYVNFVYGNISDSHSLALLLATALYSFQIYCDFSGYSDMAIGCAKFFGFDVGRNFVHPYLSKSVGEFWRRWHISLSSWLRDYVYIPLGGSRVALPRIYANLVITFLVSGIWHGSTVNFVIWGLLHGAYQCAGRALKPLLEKAKTPSFVKIAVTFCLVTFAWIFFRASSLSEAFTVIRGISYAPADVLSLLSLKNTIGVKEALRTVFALTDETFGGFSGMATLLAVLMPFVCISIATRNTDGLSLVRKQDAVIRWAAYYAFAVIMMLSANLGLSSNFIYNNF